MVVDGKIHPSQCPINSCTELANTYTAVISFVNEDKKKKLQDEKDCLSSPMLLCSRHALDRLEYFHELGRKTKSFVISPD